MIRLELGFPLMAIALMVLLLSCSNQLFSGGFDSPHSDAQTQLLDDAVVVASDTKSVGKQEKDKLENTSEKRTEDTGLASLLINEFAAVRNPELIQMNQCLDLVKTSGDAQFAQRCYELSLRHSDTNAAVDAAQMWVSVAPTSDLAHQQLGRALIVDKRYAQALDSLLAAESQGLDVDVTSPAVNSVFLYGEELIKLISQYQKKSQEFPNNKQLRFGEVILRTRRSEQNYYIGNYEEAVTSLNELIDLDTNIEIDGEKIYFERPYLFRARSLQRLKRSQEAISSLEQAIAKHEDYVTLRLELTDLYLQKNSYVKAEQTVLELLEATTSSNIYYEVGKLVAGSPLSQAAAIVRERLLQDSQNDQLTVAQNELSLLRLGVLAELVDDKSSKKKYLLKIKKTPDLIVAATSEIAIILRDESGESAGEEYFHQARARWPAVYDALWQAQAQWLARTNRKKAISFLDEIIAANPSEGLIFTRGFYNSLDGNITEMERDFQAILDKNPRHTDALNAYGYTLVDRTDRLDEGTAMIARAFSLQSERPAIVDSLGWAYYKQGKLQQALVLVHWAYAHLQDSEIGAHYGEILWALGYQKQAKLLLDQELLREPENEVLKSTFERLFDSEQQ